ncbi:MAG: dynamin family protein, partial [Aeromicrobium sp.]
MPSEHASAELLGALSKLHGQVQQASLRLATPTVVDARKTQAEVLDQLSDYVLPRLVQLEAPLLAVVGGSTGAGKSTLVNSIVGERITESGVLRPTTRSPVLVHNPADSHWFKPDRILPEMPRTLTPSNDTYALRLAPTTRVPQGLAILDAPDVDSIDKGNRELAAQLLAAADLWLFVTSAARYADQVPWDYLRAAAERSTSVAVVLDRTATEATFEVRGHLARMMTSRGLSDSPLFTVPESGVDIDGLLPAAAVADIRGWLHDLAADPAARSKVIMQTLDGAIRQNVFHAHDIADAVDEQIAASEALNRDLDNCYRKAIEDISAATGDGSMLRGEVLARWQDFVGTGELLRSVEEKVGRLRDRVMEGVAGKRTRSNEVSEAVEQGMHMLLLEHAENAAESVSRSWGSVEAGRILLDSTRGLDRASRDFRTKAERAVRDWQQGVLELVRTEGADKRMTAKFLAFGVNGIGVALMIVMFSHTAGITGGEAGIAGGTAVIGQKLLEAIFGDQAVRRLAEQAHADLAGRVAVLLDGEKNRYEQLLDLPETIRASQSSLREAAQR